MSLWLTLVLLAQIDKLWGMAARRGAWFTYIADVNILPLPRSSAGKTVVTTKQAVPPRGAPILAFGAAKTKSRSDESRCGFLLYFCLCALCHLTAQTTEDLFLRRYTKAVTEACAEQSSVTYLCALSLCKRFIPKASCVASNLLKVHIIYRCKKACSDRNTPAPVSPFVTTQTFNITKGGRYKMPL